LWDVGSGKQIRQFDTQPVPPNPGLSGPREAPGEFQNLAITPDGRHAVTGSTGGAVCVWDISTGKVVRNFDQQLGTVYGIAASPQGNQVLTGGRGMTARLWDLSTGDELLQMPCHKSWVRSVAISPDGKRALTGSYDMTVRLWNVETGQELQAYTGHRGWIGSAKFSPDGHFAASSCGGRYSATGGTILSIDFAIRLWQLPSTGPRVATPRPRTPEKSGPAE
jgi:WD40 repeat protein